MDHRERVVSTAGFKSRLWQTKDVKTEKKNCTVKRLTVGVNVMGPRRLS